MNQSVIARVARAALRFVPDGTLLPVLTGPLRGHWFVRSGRFYAYNGGGYEPHVQRAIVSLLCQGDCFFDLGAHLGFHTLLGAKCVGPGGTVAAFEPHPENAAAIDRHLRANAMLDRSRVLPYAVADADGEEPFQRVEASSDLGKLSSTDRHPEWHDAPFSTATVRTVTLDSVMEAVPLPPPALIKIDVEGAESRVLRGAARTLREHRPTLILSVHGGRQLVASVELLGEYGYRVDPIHGDDVLLCRKA